MRNFILTPLEHKIIQSYLDTGTQIEGFRTLIHRIKNNKTTLVKDLVLITLAWNKYLQPVIAGEKPSFNSDGKGVDVEKLGLTEQDVNNFAKMFLETVDELAEDRLSAIKMRLTCYFGDCGNTWEYKGPQRDYLNCTKCGRMISVEKALRLMGDTKEEK